MDAQGFNWESHRRDWYAFVESQAEFWAAMGFSCVWLPPPTDSVSPQGYMPRDLYNLNSAYGSAESLLRYDVPLLNATCQPHLILL
jgi:alpha-amylase